MIEVLAYFLVGRLGGRLSLGDFAVVLFIYDFYRSTQNKCT